MKTPLGLTAAIVMIASVPTPAQQQGDPGTPPHSAEAGTATQNGSNTFSVSMPIGATPHSSTPSGTMAGSAGMNKDSMAGADHHSMKMSSKKAHKNPMSSTPNAN